MMAAHRHRLFMPPGPPILLVLAALSLAGLQPHTVDAAGSYVSNPRDTRWHRRLQQLDSPSPAGEVPIDSGDTNQSTRNVPFTVKSLGKIQGSGGNSTSSPSNAPSPSNMLQAADSSPAGDSSSGAPDAAGSNSSAGSSTASQQARASVSVEGTCHWKQGSAQCDAGFACVALPNNLTAGACVSEPSDGLAVPVGLAKPMFYFPLVGGSLSSWPWGSRTAQVIPQSTADGTTLFPNDDDADSLISGSLQCPGGGARLQIDNFLYGRAGPFAINLWMQVPRGAGTAGRQGGSPFQYLMSQANTQGSNTFVPFRPNQVALYMPSPGRPLSGVIRALVKDSNDGPGEVYLDSDGVVSDNTRSAPLPSLFANVSDGLWHMVTLTTRPDGSRGYQLYVDAREAGQVPSLRDSFLGQGSEVDGGDAMFLTGPLVLCGRSDGDPSRSFAGRLAHLMVVDSALQDNDVKALYDQVVEGNALGSSARKVPAGSILGGDSSTVTIGVNQPSVQVSAPTLYDTTALFWPQLPPNFLAATSSSPVTITPAAFRGSTGGASSTSVPDTASFSTAVTYGAQEGDACTLDLARTTSLTFCVSGLVCVPQRMSASTSTPSSAFLPDGVCAKPSRGVLLPTSYPPSFPTPLAYFPLTATMDGGTGLSSWPDGTYGGTAQGAGFVYDTRWGSALLCNKSRNSTVLLDAVPYATDGGFAINMWMRTTQRNMAGTHFSYLYSHASTDTTDVLTGPNQVHLYTPQRNNTFYGVSARAILRDSQSTPQGRPSQVWVDSNGMVGNDLAAVTVLDGVRIDDGDWHMLTVSTLPGKTDTPWGENTTATSTSSSGNSGAGGAAPELQRPAGFALYVDGVLRGMLQAGSMRDTLYANDTEVQITGGYPANLDGPITLCDRFDQDPNRGFTGAVSNLMLFDVALSPSQVAELYTTYAQQSVRYPMADVSDGGLTANQTTVDGDACVFPLSFGGHLYYSCIYMGGVLSCPTQKGGSWAACANPAPGVVPDTDLDLSGYAIADGTQLGPAAGGIPRLTTGGQVCVMPFIYNDQSFVDCVQANGTEMCEVAGGRLQECAPLIQRPVNSSATSCLDIRRVEAPTLSFTQCVGLKGSTMCSTGSGTWLVCPPALSPRVTLTGQLCQIPFKYAGMVRSDCVLDPNSSTDQEQCPSSNITLPDISALLTGTIQRGTSTEAGPMAVTPGNTGDAGSSVGGTSTRTPLVVSGSSNMQQCQPAYQPPPELQPRFPTRFTLDGQRCLPPGPGALSECLDYDGRGYPQCQTMSGAVFMCATTIRNGSVTNSACAFPYLFRGFNRTDCVWVDGIEACKTSTGEWEECRPWVSTQLPTPPPNTTARYSTMGIPCATPYSYQGRPEWGCVSSTDTDPGYCRVIDGTWQPCAPTNTNNTRTTILGDTCVLPFVSRGITFYDCQRINPATGSAGECLSRDGRFTPCAPRPRVGAASGQPCILPAMWAGRNVTDCVLGPVPGSPACLTSLTGPNINTGGTAPTWEPCAPLYGNITPHTIISASGGPPVTAAVPGTGGASSSIMLPTAFDGAMITAPGSKGTGDGSTDYTDDDNDNSKNMNLALGLVFGLGGGLLLLAALIGVAHREWQRRHRRWAMREMGFSGPMASEAVAAQIAGRTGVGSSHSKDAEVTSGMTGMHTRHHRDTSPAGTGQQGLELGASAHTLSSSQRGELHRAYTGASAPAGADSFHDVDLGRKTKSTAERFAQLREQAGLPVVPGKLPRASDTGGSIQTVPTSGAYSTPTGGSYAAPTGGLYTMPTGGSYTTATTTGSTATPSPAAPYSPYQALRRELTQQGSTAAAAGRELGASSVPAAAAATSAANGSPAPTGNGAITSSSTTPTGTGATQQPSTASAAVAAAADTTLTSPLSGGSTSAMLTPMNSFASSSAVPTEQRTGGGMRPARPTPPVPESKTASK